MQYARCKCGAYEAWTSGMPLNGCAWCKKCGTTPAYRPEGHKTERPAHQMVTTKVDTDDGNGKLTRCKWCMRTKASLEKDGEPMEAAA